VKRKPSPGTPFPPVNDPPYQARIVEALLATEGVTLRRDAAHLLASMITDRASDLITKPDKAGRAQIRRERLYERRVGDNDWVLEVKCRPTWNAPWSHNTRIEPEWDAPERLGGRIRLP
jgi:hypothetical protein